MHATATKASAQSESATAVAERTRAHATPSEDLQQMPLWAQNGLSIQTSLQINAPGDKYEREADRVADQVMRMPAPVVQRKACSCGQLASLDGRCPECKKKNLGIQRMISGDASQTMAPSTGSQALQQPGRPLDHTTRSFMESRFGANFGEVNIHTGLQSIQMNRDLNAHAFTVGSNIYFNRGMYNPQSRAGKHLLAHELTHVVQQRAGGHALQRKACPRSRPKGEAAKSEEPAGLLTHNVVFDARDNKLFIQDFAVNEAALPPGVTTSSSWQRVMSIIAGIPSRNFVGVFGYSDCLGSEGTNRTLRDERADAVYNAMPTVAQVKVLWHTGDFVNHFITTNETAEGRAQNRAVTIKIAEPTVPGEKDVCDFLGVASDLDQYMFLVRCLETRLGLTSKAYASKTLSVLRQLYYGNASWTNASNRNKVWDDVITERPWSPGDDPSLKLGPTLFDALQKSQKVFNEGQMLDIGHLLTGMDAARKPQNVEANVGPITLVTDVENHAWATWAGDVGSAAAYHTFCVAFLNFTSTYEKYFKSFASDSDLEGNIDSYANWAWLDAGTPDPKLKLDRPLSEVLMQYYRLTNTKAGQARAGRFETFVNFYGGEVKSGKITKSRELEANLASQIGQFAILFLGQKVISAYKGMPLTACIGTPPASGGPSRSVEIGDLLADLFIATSKMTDLFVDWLKKRL